MPSWSIHLKVGKEIYRKYNFDKDKFLFGNLLGDTDKDWKLNRYLAHYYGTFKYPKCPKEDMIDIESFINDYKDKFNDDLILGYYCHLLTDNFYNEYIYYNKWVLNKYNDVIGIKTKNNKVIYIKGNKDKARYKHFDLNLYGKHIYNNEELIIPSNVNSIIESLNILKNQFVTKENVLYRLNYLNNDFKEFNKISLEEKDKGYVMFSKEELDKLLEDCINYIDSKLKEIIK